MPRLLLVDDNPSIHKIAETLLTASPIELVCVESAAAALDRIGKGEHFDVALLDTSMAGMDGWGLLARLRETPATARMPIAMMAGVLDTVDPERIQNAPIQGFLKKPVELRDLGERITKLMETPVVLPAPSTFATMPGGARIDDLPEFRDRKPEPEPLSKDLAEDLLELTEEDLYPEAPAPEPAAGLVEEPIEENLDLEELDLESLKGLTALPEVTVTRTAALPEALSPESRPTPQADAFSLESLDAISTLDGLPELEPRASFGEVEAGDVELPDLGPVVEESLEIQTLSGMDEVTGSLQAAPVSAPEDFLGQAGFTPPLPPLEESLDWSDDSDSMLAIVESPVPAMDVPLLPEPGLDLLEVPAPSLAVVPEPAPAKEPGPTEELVESAILESAATPVGELPSLPPPPAAAAGAPKDLLEAITSDPVLMEALAKAVVARLGDQVLREVAWEVMPDLAERLPRG